MQLVEGHIITEKKKRISQLYLTPKLMIPPLTQVLHFQCRVIDCLPEITSISHTPSGSLILKSLYLYCITSATDIYSIGSKTTNYQISTNWMGKTKVNLKSTRINMQLKTKMTEKISYQALPGFYSKKHLLKTHYESIVLE